MKSPGDTLIEKADAAFHQAARKVIEQARQSGTTIILWENGQVIERTWEEVERAVAKILQDKPGANEEGRSEKKSGGEKGASPNRAGEKDRE